MNSNNQIVELQGAKIEKWAAYRSTMEQVLAKVGFTKEKIGDVDVFVYNQLFCKISQLLFPDGEVYFVLEWGRSEEEVKKNIMEDGDLYSGKLSEGELRERLEKDLMEEIRTE